MTCPTDAVRVDLRGGQLRELLGVGTKVKLIECAAVLLENVFLEVHRGHTPLVKDAHEGVTGDCESHSRRKPENNLRSKRPIVVAAQEVHGTAHWHRAQIVLHDFGDKAVNLRVRREEDVWSTVERESVVPVGLGQSADPRLDLDDRDVKARFGQLVASRHPADTGAHNEDAWSGHPLIRSHMREAPLTLVDFATSCQGRRLSGLASRDRRDLELSSPGVPAGLGAVAFALLIRFPSLPHAATVSAIPATSWRSPTGRFPAPVCSCRAGGA
jgi:hypothetical protein